MQEHTSAPANTYERQLRALTQKKQLSSKDDQRPAPEATRQSPQKARQTRVQPHLKATRRKAKGESKSESSLHLLPLLKMLPTKC
jgi:hypothetical protein